MTTPQLKSCTAFCLRKEAEWITQLNESQTITAIKKVKLEINQETEIGSSVAEYHYIEC